MNINDEKLAADVTALSGKCTCAFPCGGTEPQCPSAPQSALSTQVGGGHYKNLAIQPVEFAMTQGYDFCAASILKYLSRHETKNGRQDAEKALHFAHLRVAVARKHDLKRILHAVKSMWAATGLTWVLSTDANVCERTDMQQYILVNGFTGDTAEALRQLESWVVNGHPARTFFKLNNVIAKIIASYDSTNGGENNNG